ncbi:hypothetical protein [Planctomicrobium piriforme]|uniref:Uncharacterized protein n=1 Tax=Planctomicrobium piriforme TaxID=1576369 RepID=A0A1I3M4Q2_9PLAN|nr:hypothetical protein [Planctomicrobium piriforme]SFI91994.1 hypothetical protein SAMN05421753_113158 [Planctomicrobium piriforme]
MDKQQRIRLGCQIIKARNEEMIPFRIQYERWDANEKSQFKKYVQQLSAVEVPPNVPLDMKIKIGCFTGSGDGGWEIVELRPTVILKMIEAWDKDEFFPATTNLET